MVLTGGFVDPGDAANEFQVWLLNLMHADMFGDEDWFHVENLAGEDDATVECPEFDYNNEPNDPEQDLWQHSVKCTPSSRHDHMSAAVKET